ncbi:MAG: class I SAM-dependent methyltransferase [Pseudonocardiaceae bacterium]
MDALIWSLHAGLPRQAPGSDTTTQAMLTALDLAPGARVVDMGCGPGRSSLVLAAAGLDVVAVDTHQPFLDELTTAARTAGLAARVHPLNASIAAVPLPSRSVDAVWSEGAAYLIGFGNALNTWPALRGRYSPGTRIADGAG